MKDHHREVCMTSKDRFQAQLDRLCRVKPKYPEPVVTGIAREMAEQKEAAEFWDAIRNCEGRDE